MSEPGGSAGGPSGGGSEPGTTALRGRVVTPEVVYDDGVVLVEGDRIVTVGDATAYDGPRPVDCGTLLPGLVDIHDHGGGGSSFTSADDAEISAAAHHHRARGTTAVVASAVTDSAERMVATVAALAQAVGRGEIEAIHVEGPFLSHGRCGAQDPRHLRDPDLGLARELVKAGEGHVAVMTVAPELPGAGELRELLRDEGVVVAVGHTEADATTTERALSGGGLVTHLFNAMPSLHHRDPGPVAGAFAAAGRGEARVELVADGVHLSDDVVRSVFAVLGPARVVLVTDAMAAAGMADGEYRLGPQQVRVQDGVARLAEGDGAGSIAGGTSSLLDVVRRCVQHAGVGLREAVLSASVTPAAALGHGDRLGGLVSGLRADVVEVDDDLQPVRVMRAGRWV